MKIINYTKFIINIKRKKSKFLNTIFQGKLCFEQFLTEKKYNVPSPLIDFNCNSSDPKHTKLTKTNSTLNTIIKIKKEPCVRKTKKPLIQESLY